MGILGPMMIERLDLSQDQRDRVKQILDSHRDDQQALAQRAMAAREALESVITAANFDESLIRAKAADLAAVETDQTVARARIYAEVFQILTSEQQAKLKTLQAERQQRQIGIVQPGEERQVAEQLVSHRPFKYCRMMATAAAPSPVADETR